MDVTVTLPNLVHGAFHEWSKLGLGPLLIDFRLFVSHRRDHSLPHFSAQDNSVPGPMSC